MYTLFSVRFNWYIYAVIAVAIRLIFFDISWYSYFALLIALHQFILLFNAYGSVIPVRYLFGAFMCLQMLLGPTFAYNGLDQYQVGFYKMQIEEAEYFSYAIPAVICFILGLHLRAGSLEGEKISMERIHTFISDNPQLPYYFIGIGLGSSVVSIFFSSSLSFVFYLLGNLKFIGLFMLILGNRYLKPIPLIIVLASIISSSLGGGMFQDLLTWLLFLASIYAIRYRPSVIIKASLSLGFIILAVVIQQLKADYRSATWKQGQTGGIEVFSNTYQKKNESNSIFSFESLAPSNIRINQGFIVTNIMKTVPNKEPYSNGRELLQILEAAFMPRILAPDKLNAGNRDIFIKYSGMPLARGTSMGLSSLGDAYINFGIWGGCIFMFILGFVYSEVLNAFGKGSRRFPILPLFTCLIFYYPIRPDCELQTILGHLVKACFLVYMMLQIWRSTFEANDIDN